MERKRCGASCEYVAEEQRKQPLGGIWARRRRYMLALGACIAVIALAGCSSAGSGGSAKNGGTLTMARATQPTTFDPTVGETFLGSEAVDIQIFDQLVELLPGSTQPQPGLAESWTVGDGGRVYTFHLRSAKFSNGTPVTSEDVAFSFGRLTNPTIDAGFAPLFSFIKKIETPNPSTVVLRLSHPANYLLAYLTFGPASIVPKRYFEHVGASRFAEAPIGSGAFVMKRFIDGVKTVLQRNPYYWRAGLPHVNQVELLYIPDDNTRVLDLRSGQVDIADEIPYSQIAPLRQTAGIKVVVTRVANIFQLPFNLKYPPLRETAVRQALNYATPRESIRNVVFHGEAEIANSMIPPNKYWDAKLPPYPYNLEKARQLLATSKYPHGFNLELQITGTDEASRETAEILQQSWGMIGVHVKILEEDEATVENSRNTEKFQAWLNTPAEGYSDMPIDDEIAQAQLENLPATNAFFTSYNNPEVNKLINEAVNSPSEKRRAQLYREVQRVAMADPPQDTMVFPPARGAVRSDVKGFAYTDTTWWRLEDVSVSR